MPWLPAVLIIGHEYSLYRYLEFCTNIGKIYAYLLSQIFNNGMSFFSAQAPNIQRHTQQYTEQTSTPTSSAVVFPFSSCMLLTFETRVFEPTGLWGWRTVIVLSHLVWLVNTTLEAAPDYCTFRLQQEVLVTREGRHVQQLCTVATWQKDCYVRLG